jgi:hypothetical protein
MVRSTTRSSRIPTVAALTLAAILAAGVGAAAQQQTPQPGQPSPQSPPSAQEVQKQPDGAMPPGQTQGALQTESGRAGKQEGGSPAPAASGTDNAAFVNGRLAAPGAPQEGATVPSKFSARNAALDRLPIMAMRLQLSDAQKRSIYESVSETKPASGNLSIETAQALPKEIELHPLPKKITEAIPAVSQLKYARTENKVLLVQPPNRIVVGEIEK